MKLKYHKFNIFAIMINEENTVYRKIIINDATNTRAKITKIDQIIDALFDAQITLANEELGIEEYRIDTGQSIHQVKKTTVSGIATLIEKYEKMRTMYQNRLLNPMTKLADGRNFKHRNG